MPVRHGFTTICEGPEPPGPEFLPHSCRVLVKEAVYLASVRNPVWAVRLMPITALTNLNRVR